VQGASTTTPYSVWPERIATSYGVSALCARYVATSQTNVILNPSASACTNYAVGGGRINNPTGPTTPFAIGQQLIEGATAAATYKSSDLLLIDGGGNDAADLAGAFLTASADNNYITLLATLGVTPTAATQAALAIAGGSYMAKLADKLYAAVKTNALDKGATRVVVVNAPGITNTPRFKALLALVAAGAGGGSVGAATAANIDAMIKSWVETYNTALAAKFAGDSRVAIVDFYTEFNNQVLNPAQFALTNVTTPACPSTGTGTDGLPTYNFLTCTSTALNASTPNWQSYAFSDGFHPTPYGHQLLAQLVSRSLIAAGWL
jgi:outer membrane lipase/esterase